MQAQSKNRLWFWLASVCHPTGVKVIINTCSKHRNVSLKLWPTSSSTPLCNIIEWRKNIWRRFWSDYEFLSYKPPRFKTLQLCKPDDCTSRDIFSLTAYCTFSIVKTHLCFWGHCSNWKPMLNLRSYIRASGPSSPNYSLDLLCCLLGSMLT